METGELPILDFKNQADLRTWLEANHLNSIGAWVRLYKKSSGMPTVTFEELLDEGLCFGWSESTRRSYDEKSYLQKFTPRKTKGTISERNRRHVEKLIDLGKMTQAGLDAM